MSNTPLEQNGIDLSEILTKVNALPSGGGITPTGSITLTEERTYDVTDKATAVVDFSTTRANLAEAVTAKGVDTLPTSSFDTIATNIGLISGGGGELPSVISKIDGGSFTIPSTTAASTYRIEHNLGEIPQGFFVWCEEEKAFQTSDRNYYLIWAVGAKGEIKTSETAAQFYSINIGRRNTTGAVSGVGSNAASAAQTANYATTIDFCVYKTSDLFYRSGYTYKWLAWA